MVNKKGYIRTLEAIIAIVLIFAVIITILPKKEIAEKTPEDIDLTAKSILNEIQNNNLFRDYAIKMDISNGIYTDALLVEVKAYTELKNFVDSTMPIAIGYELMICEISGGCYPLLDSIVLPKKSIYTKSVLINNNNVINSNSEDRIVKLFLWRKV